MSVSATHTQTKKAAANESRPGYKHTKLGWIPQEWKVKQLGDVGAILMCKRIFKDETTDRGEVPFFKIGTFGGEPDAFITLKKFEDYRSRFSFPKEGDILISAAGTIGRTVVYDGRPAYYQDSNIVWINNDEDQVLNTFLRYVYPRIRWETDTSTIPRLYNNSIRQTRILVPPLPEQRRIAEVLGAWDRAIATVQLLLAAQQERKRGILGTVVEKLYHGAHKVNVGDVASEIKERNTENTDHIVLSCSKHRGFVSSLEYFKKQVFSEDRSNYKVIRRGQFGFPANHIEEGSIDLLRDHEVGLVSPIYVIIEFDPASVNSEFMYYLFKSDRYRHIFRTSTNASVDRRGSLRWNDFQNLWVPLPDRDEQDRIAKLLTGLDRQIEKTQEYLDLLTHQKRGLMQVLLTGVKRLTTNN